MAKWPNKSERDTSQALGEEFIVVHSVKPNNPAVPPSASGALRLPLRVL